MAETPLPLGKTCNDCTTLLSCLARGRTDETRTVCAYDPSRFADKGPRALAPAPLPVTPSPTHVVAVDRVDRASADSTSAIMLLEVTGGAAKPVVMALPVMPKPPKTPSNSQRRRQRKAADKVAKRAALEKEFGIKVTPSRPIIGGRYAGVKQAPTIRYPKRGGRG